MSKLKCPVCNEETYKPKGQPVQVGKVVTVTMKCSSCGHTEKVKYTV